jgi:hypothetical protein
MSAESIRGLPVHVINKMVMKTEDVETLTGWLDEEKTGAKRLSAMRRIHHRLNSVRGRLEYKALDKVKRKKWTHD